MAKIDIIQLPPIVVRGNYKVPPAVYSLAPQAINLRKPGLIPGR